MDRSPHRQWRIAHSEASTSWGGQEHRVLAELAGFRQRGCSIWLLTPPEAQLRPRAIEADVPVRSLAHGRLQSPFQLLALARWLRRERIEILNTHSSRDGWLLGVAGRLAHVPLILRTRHIDVDYPNRRLSRHAFTTLADHVLTTSQKITSHFQEYFGLPAERVSTIPTGIDLERFSPRGQRAPLPFQNAQGSNGPCLGMISVLRNWKGHKTFLEAIRRLTPEYPALRGVIVGEGPSRYYVEEWIQNLGLEKTVALAGYRQDIPEILRSLSALVIPSTRHEGIPQIGLQALATQTPVIGSDAGGIPEIVQPGVTGRIFPAGDADALADAIRDLFSQKEKTQPMSERGRSLVEARYSLTAMIERLDQLYHRYLE